MITLDVDSSILSRRDSRQKLMQTARKLKSGDRLMASLSNQTVEKYERRNLKTFVSNQRLQRKKFTGNMLTHCEMSHDWLVSDSNKVEAMP